MRKKILKVFLGAATACLGFSAKADPSVSGPFTTYVTSAKPADSDLPGKPIASASGSPTYWLSCGTNVAVAHVGKKRKDDGKYTGVTVMWPGSGQYNGFPLGPDCGITSMMPDYVAKYGLDKIGVFFTTYKNSLFKRADIAYLYLGHELNSFADLGVKAGYIFDGYNNEKAGVAVSLKITPKDLAGSFDLTSLAKEIPSPLYFEFECAPAKPRFWERGNGANGFCTAGAGLKFSLG